MSKRTTRLPNSGLRMGASAAILAFAALSAQAYAQDAAPAATAAAPSEDTVVVVTGIRGALKSALNIKRSSVGVVDAIASDDLGKMADTNVAESLQRVPGVTINRSNGDGQVVTVRGLGPGFNAVTVNNRLIASDSGGREFNFDVLPSELITGVSVYKSPLANLSGSSIGATIDIKTARPLDLAPRVLVMSAQVLDSTIGQTTDPAFSALASYHNDARTFGVSLAVAYMARNVRVDQFRDDGNYSGRGNAVDTDYFYGRSAPGVPIFTNATSHQTIGADVLTDDDKRLGISGSVQWVPTEGSKLTLDFLNSRYDALSTSTGYNFDWDRGTLAEASVVGGTPTTMTINGVPQTVIVGGELVNQKIMGGNFDEIVNYQPRKVNTNLIGLNYAWGTGAWTFAADAAYSEAKRTGGQEAIFSTIRRKNVTTFLNSSNGGPLYEIGAYYDNDATASNPMTTPTGIFAHYMQPGSQDVNDKITQGTFDAKWHGSDAVTLTSGIGYQKREKDITTWGRDFSHNCQFCNSDFELPASMFSAGGYNIFSNDEGPMVRDWVKFDSRELVTYLSAHMDQATGGGFAEKDPAWVPISIQPAQSPQVSERVFSGYMMADIKVDVANMPLQANIGLRYEDTSYTSVGFGQEVLSAIYGDRGDGIYVTNVVLGPVQATQSKGRYHDILPTVNVKLNLTDELVARAAFSRVVTRPYLGALVVNQVVDGVGGIGNPSMSRGNPGLQPYRATQVDLGLEWYFSRLGVLSGSIFEKDLDSFITTATSQERIDQVTFEVTQPINGKGATIKGLELVYQQTYDNGIGYLLNYTHVDSTATFVKPTGGGTAVYSMEGLSPNSYNVVGFYTKGPFEARVAYTYRDTYVQSAFGAGNLPSLFDAYGQVDASIQYTFGKHWTLSLQGVNITDEREYVYVSDPTQVQRYAKTGPRYTLGLRAKF